MLLLVVVADGAVDDVVGKVGDANVEDIGDADDITVDDIGGGWFLDEGWRSVDGMLPVNTAGSPGGGLQWPSATWWWLAAWWNSRCRCCWCRCFGLSRPCVCYPETIT